MTTTDDTRTNRRPNRTPAQRTTLIRTPFKNYTLYTHTRTTVGTIHRTRTPVTSRRTRTEAAQSPLDTHGTTANERTSTYGGTVFRRTRASSFGAAQNGHKHQHMHTRTRRTNTPSEPGPRTHTPARTHLHKPRTLHPQARRTCTNIAFCTHTPIRSTHGHKLCLPERTIYARLTHSRKTARAGFGYYTI